MGIPAAQVTDDIRLRMIASDRKKFGRRLMTKAEARDKYCRTLERKIHDQFSGFLSRLGLEFVHSHPTRKSSIRAGWPDYTVCLGGRFLCIEFKVAGNKLSAVQSARIDHLRAGGSAVFVITESAEGSAYAEAVQRVREFFNLWEAPND